MSVSAVAPTPFYQDPDRLPIGLPQASSAGKADAAANGDGKHLSMFAAGDEEPSFWDLLDVINPLQHIPVVSNIYRELTGDQIGVGARLVGGALFGGPIGLIASAVNCVVEESSGKDMGGHMLALFRDEGESSPGTTQFAHTPASNTQAANAAAAVPAVSSSPAGAVAAASNGTSQAGAPVISLPEISAGPAASQPMVFSLDGMQAAGAPSPAPAPAPVTVAAMDAAQPATAAQPAAKPMP
ncbi:MAG TPA: hypothetical protein VK196_11615, partial [Magnetospirillum sp.]|nr:hypothetical protein [Magnetospirillum sp.]